MSSFDPSIPRERTAKAFYLALFFAAFAWSVSSRLLSASSAEGITHRFRADWATPLLGPLFFLFLLGVGFSVLDIIARRTPSARQVFALPRRATASREWLVGVALGWGMVVLAVLPLALLGQLRVETWFPSEAWGQLFLNLAILAAVALAQETIYRGYPFRRLIEAIGPVAATGAMSLLYALIRALETRASIFTVFLAFLTGIVFSIAWLRTHGMWLGWGMRFGWMASMGLLFGLPVTGSSDFSSVIQTTAVGRTWLTGGDYGPEASFLMLFALIVGVIVLVRVTRDYAWNYTHAPIVPGGYPMDVPPPSAHTAMEEEAKTKTSALIQILPATPQGRSVDDSSASE